MTHAPPPPADTPAPPSTAIPAAPKPPAPTDLWSWPGWGMLLPLLAIVGTVLAYLPHVCPVLFVGDSGELITAAATGGIAHPPGYPLYTMLLHAWLLLPWQSPSTWQAALFGPAYGANCFSLACVALSVALVTSLVWQQGRHAGWAILAGAIWAVTPTLFSQALVAEVYGLQILLVTALLAAYWRLIEIPAPGNLAIVALMQGLMLAHHPSAILWLPVTALVVLLHAKQIRYRHNTPWLIALAALLIGLAPFLYLPVESLKDPWLDWGNPDNWERFWAVVTRADYRAIKAHLDASEAIGIGGVLSRWASWTWHQFGVLTVPLLLGAVLAFQKPTRWTLVLALAWFCATVPYWWYFRTIPKTELHYLEVYFLSSHVLLVLWGFSGLLQQATSPRPWLTGWQAGILGVIALGLIPYQWPTTVKAESRAQSQLGSRFALSTLLSIPDHSLLVCEGDEIFLYWYLQAVAGVKTDVVILEADILRDTGTWYWADLRRRQHDLAIPPTLSTRDLAKLGLTETAAIEAYQMRQLVRMNGDRRAFQTGISFNPAKQGEIGVGYFGLLYEVPGAHADELACGHHAGR
ncbi:MAG: DUF2723 domain-containing protein, partial [bacterium]